MSRITLHKQEKEKCLQQLIHTMVQGDSKPPVDLNVECSVNLGF